MIFDEIARAPIAVQPCSVIWYGCVSVFNKESVIMPGYAEVVPDFVFLLFLISLFISFVSNVVMLFFLFLVLKKQGRKLSYINSLGKHGVLALWADVKAKGDAGDAFHAKAYRFYRLALHAARVNWLMVAVLVVREILK